MKIVLAIEGMDGSGKSSLARFIQSLCEQHQCRCTAIGRRSCTISPAVVKLTEILREEVRNLTPQADIFVRLAREYQRAHLAASAPRGVVVLDRFVLTILSLIRIHGQDAELLTPLLREITMRANLHATIFVQCPFETATSRVKERRQRLPSGSKSEILLRRVAGYLEEEFHRGALTGQQWLVDNSKTLSDGEDQVAAYLLPYLVKD
ncbi:MAG TPA: hypothetical protein VK395_19780 [Gemmataceae bacterium]|nr:hypothetical protein [Gemmataceae bacterium]